MNIQQTAKLLTLAFLGCTALDGRALAQCPDSFEDNDTCAQAISMTTGSYTGLGVTMVDSDWYRVSVPPGNELQVSLTFLHWQGDVDVTLLDTDCTTVLAQSTSSDDDEYFTWTNYSGSWHDVSVHVYLYLPHPDYSCASYAMTLSVIDTLGCGPDDPTGDNDTCGTANPLLPGYFIGFNVYANDDDYYRVTVPGREAFYAGLGFTHASGDVDLYVYSANCGTLLESSTSTSDDEDCTWKNLSSFDQDVVVRVHLYSGLCNTYQMTLETYDVLCWGDDFLDDNDSCSAAAVLTAGLQTMLFVGETDHDWYKVSVPASHALAMEATFQHIEGDIDIVLYDSCGGAPIAVSNGLGDVEHVSTTNNTTVAKDYFLWVFVYDYGNGPDCNSYDLMTAITTASPGANYCVSLPNTTGAPALISGTGSNSVAANDLVLSAGPVTAGEFGIFFYGSTPDQVLFGPNSYLCIQQPVIRLDIHQASPGGVLQHALDITSPPQAWGQITPGSVWLFQAWFRDPTHGFSLSDGYEVVFTP